MRKIESSNALMSQQNKKKKEIKEKIRKNKKT
jgi:hypothetical protein